VKPHTRHLVFVIFIGIVLLLMLITVIANASSG